MDGFCVWFEDERRFVILTTAANESMRKVHDRMPLILEKEQLADWLCAWRRTFLRVKVVCSASCYQLASESLVKVIASEPCSEPPMLLGDRLC